MPPISHILVHVFGGKVMDPVKKILGLTPTTLGLAAPVCKSTSLCCLGCSKMAQRYLHKPRSFPNDLKILASGELVHVARENGPDGCMPDRVESSGRFVW